MDQREELKQAIAALEAQRAVLGDAVVNTATAPLREKLAALEQAGPAATAERKLVTVMFADLSGFTTLAETMDPEQARDLMNNCFDRLAPVIEKYGGTIDKFIGDAVMALFGAPTAHENDAERALRAALEMMAALEDFNTAHGADLGLHIGVNTGLVIAGGIGSREQREYSVMGDAVNVASRLGDISRRGEIIVGPDTRRLAARWFRFEPLPSVQVKGRTKKVAIYRLVGLRSSPKPRGLPGLASPLVGRKAELAALNGTVERAAAGRGGVVTLVGEAGLGKSRLMAEVHHRWEKRARVRWLEGRCLSHTASTSYTLWLDMLHTLLGPPPLAPALRRLIQDFCPHHSDRVYPYLARLLSLPPEEYEPVGEVEGEELKSGVFDAVETLLRCMAERQPLVLVCEDLHWADPTSLELLNDLLPLIEQVPLLLICIFRPEPDHTCRQVEQVAADRYGHRHTAICLEPLSKGESTALLGNLLHVEDLPATLGKRILTRAEGNPFYLEEIIRSLIDNRTIAYDEVGGRWETTQDVTDTIIPDTLNGVLLARIDRLPDDTKQVIRLASVIGRIFSRRLLAAILPQEENLAAHLERLQQEEMIRLRAESPEPEYIFKHQLTQEAAYRSILRRERRTFHRRVAEAIEKMSPDRIDEQVGILAHHWEQANVPEKAIEYLLRAGDKARMLYTHQEAIGYYERALALLKEQEDHERSARTLMKLGLTYHTAFDFARSRRAYEEGFALWQRAGAAERLPPPQAGEKERILRVGWWNPTSLDPTMSNDLYSANVIDQLFDGLVELTPEMEVMPCVARTWQVSEGGQRYIFYLKKGLRWSDGEPLTAHDFEYAWKRVLDPATASRNAEMLYDIKGGKSFHRGESKDRAAVGVQALDPYTLSVELEGPTSYFLQLLTQPLTRPIPRHIVERYGDEWTKVENIVINGPFLIEKWEQARVIRLVRNPAYHGRFEGNLDRVELWLLTDPLELMAMYQRDELDVLNLGVLPPEKRDQARRQNVREYIVAPVLSVMFTGFHTGRPPFDNPLVRRAFVLAIDREELAGMVLRGYVFPATGGFVPPGMPGHSPGIGLPYNPKQAQRLLAEAGYPSGKGLPAVRMVGFRGFEAASEFLTTRWRETLGAEIEWETLEYSLFAKELDSGAAHIFLSGWTADFPDPDNFLRNCPARHDARWQDNAYSRLVEKARRATSQAERIELYRQADAILIREAVIAPLAYSRTHMLIKPWVRRMPTSANRYWFWKNVIVRGNP